MNNDFRERKTKIKKFTQKMFASGFTAAWSGACSQHSHEDVVPWLQGFSRNYLSAQFYGEIKPVLAENYSTEIKRRYFLPRISEYVLNKF